MNGLIMSTAFHVACAGFKRARNVMESKDTTLRVYETTSRIGLKYLFAAIITQVRTGSTGYPGGDSIRDTGWMTFP